MTRAVSQAEMTPRQLAAMIERLVQKGCRVRYEPGGVLEVTPPASGPQPPQDPFDLLDMRR